MSLIYYVVFCFLRGDEKGEGEGREGPAEPKLMTLEEWKALQGSVSRTTLIRKHFKLQSRERTCLCSYDVY
jgi:hypothetical protein